ncbi:MAG: hypothetical protein ACXWEY_12015 [Bacteroidia bacterium]
MKKPVWICLLFLAFAGTLSCKKTTNELSPYLAPTALQQKAILLEQFIGVRCPFDPDATTIANAIRDSNPGRVHVMAIHTKFYGTPFPGYPDFTTIFGDSLFKNSGVTAIPAGNFNRLRFTSVSPIVPGGMALFRQYWTKAFHPILTETAPVNIGVNTVWNGSTRTLTVTAETYYTCFETSPCLRMKL